MTARCVGIYVQRLATSFQPCDHAHKLLKSLLVLFRRFSVQMENGGDTGASVGPAVAFVCGSHEFPSTIIPQKVNQFWTEQIVVLDHLRFWEQRVDFDFDRADFQIRMNLGLEPAELLALFGCCLRRNGVDWWNSKCWKVWTTCRDLSWQASMKLFWIKSVSFRDNPP